ncbi:MAG: hypothetical protein AB7O78_05625 [Thermoleophilia bacterium]
MSTRIATLTAAALSVAALAAAPFAVASHGADDPAGDDRGGDRDRAARADVRVAGTCTLSSTAKLKLSPENGRVEVEFEVDENRNGKKWGVTMKRNGTTVRSRSAVTQAPSGSFEVRAVIAAGSPDTKVTAVARRAATGEVCRATATL